MKRLTNLNIVKRSRYAFHERDQNHAVIVAAIRTPWMMVTQLHGNSFYKFLRAYIVDNAIKQSNIDLEYIQTIYMLLENLKLEIDEKPEQQVSSLTKAIECIKVQSCGYEANDCKLFFNILNNLQANPNKAVIVGNIQMTKPFNNGQSSYNETIKEILEKLNISMKDYENYMKCNKEQFFMAQQEHLFDNELMPVTIQQKTNKSLVRRVTKYDEFYDGSETDAVPKIGAWALLITTNSLAVQLNLKPLGQIQYYSDEKNEVDENLQSVIKRLFRNTNHVMREIKHWETEDPCNILPLILAKNFQINRSQLNPEGNVAMLCSANLSFFFHKLTHLVHTLHQNELGSIVYCTPAHSAIILIRNLMYSTSEVILTLYTTKSCQLCDQMIDELKFHFDGLYKLQKVFIDCKENIRYLRLYRHDIPVLFLNGQFLCMHHLNVPLLRRKLQLMNQQ